MKLTPFAKLFVTVVVLGVLGYAFWHYKGDTVRKWAGAEKGAAADRNAAVDAADFDALKNAPADAERGKGSEGVTGAALAGAGKLGRPLVLSNAMAAFTTRPLEEVGSFELKGVPGQQRVFAPPK